VAGFLIAAYAMVTLDLVADQVDLSLGTLMPPPPP
jgi:hypothetical protein